MAFFKVSTDAKSVEESSGSSYISKSGIYNVTLKIVSVDLNKHDAKSINFNVTEENGSNTTFYGLTLDNNDGSRNFQADIFNKLCIIAGLPQGPQDPESQTHKLGKEGKPTELAVLEDFTDLECKIRVQEEYSKYQGKIRKSMKIKNFYSVDGASASEILSADQGNDVVVGTDLAKDEVYAANVTYKDNLDSEAISAWKDSKSSGGSGGAKTPAVVNKPATSLFS